MTPPPSTGKTLLALGMIIGLAAGAVGAIALHRLVESEDDAGTSPFFLSRRKDRTIVPLAAPGESRGGSSSERSGEGDPISGYSYLFDQEEGPQSADLLFEGFQARAETWSGAPPKSTRANVPLLRLVIDDVGYNIDAVDVLLNASANITLAVLPNAPFRSVAVDRASRAGASVLLHMPMEAHDHAKNRERPMLLTSMGDSELSSILEKAIADLGPIQGVSNHMGSRFTESRRSLDPVMDVLYARQLHFLDSVTSPRTVAFQTARARGIPAAARDIFLDADHTPDGVRRAWIVALQIARLKGDTVAIYHPHPATVHTLAELLRRSDTQVSYARVTPTPH